MVVLFTVHHNMKSCTGGMLTLDMGTVKSQSTKQMLNTRISTELQLFCVDDLVSLVLWVRCL